MIKLDIKDHRIVGELLKNARLSVRDIAKLTQLRPSTVHQRMQRLIREGIIEKFTLKLNNEAIGENFIVFMLIKADKDLDSSAFRNKKIKEAFGITGEYDLILKLKFSDVKEFNDYVLAFRKRYEIRNTLTMVVTANIKEEL